MTSPKKSKDERLCRFVDTIYFSGENPEMNELMADLTTKGLPPKVRSWIFPDTREHLYAACGEAASSATPRPSQVNTSNANPVKLLTPAYFERPPPPGLTPRALRGKTYGTPGPPVAQSTPKNVSKHNGYSEGNMTGAFGSLSMLAFKESLLEMRQVSSTHVPKQPPGFEHGAIESPLKASSSLGNPGESHLMRDYLLKVGEESLRQAQGDEDRGFPWSDMNDIRLELELNGTTFDWDSESEKWVAAVLSEKAKEFKAPSSRSESPSIECVFCKNNNEPFGVYTSHNVRDDFGRVTCPRLRKYQCRTCGVSGDNAHTAKYCPNKQIYTMEDCERLEMRKDTPPNRKCNKFR